MSEIVVLRLSERGYRDLRITTHCALVARAFGAKKIFLNGNQDNEIGKTVQRINDTFGGDFEVEYYTQPGAVIKKMRKEGYCMVHLTMYGEKPGEIAKQVRKKKKIAIVVGADKVPSSVYEEADYNVSITRQPHSEVAALGVFLHYLNEGKEEEMEFA
ncbi:MAG: tRNA (cytidine(56)-2'-O)-methyltransferase, partial [archaeon]